MSYIWRRIIEAQDMLRGCAAFRVGNGLIMNIVEDPWLPDEDNSYIHTINDSLKGDTVSSLFHPDKNQWNIN